MLIERIRKQDNEGRYLRIDAMVRDQGRNAVWHPSVGAFDGKAYIYHENRKNSKAIHVVDWFLLMEYLRRFKLTSL